MQHPLVFGIAGHNFLTLRDENNSIIEEYHGLATDSVTGDWKYVGRKSTDILKAWRFKGSRNYIAQKDYPGIVLEQGDKDVMITAWDKGESCKEEINTMNLPYPPYGVSLHGDTENSNSVAYTLALCMKLDAKRIGLITPGWGKDLLGEEK